jgi:hypothetical protein
VIIHTFHQRCSFHFCPLPIVLFLPRLDVLSPHFKFLHFISRIITFLILFQKYVIYRGKSLAPLHAVASRVWWPCLQRNWWSFVWYKPSKFDVAVHNVGMSGDRDDLGCNLYLYLRECDVSGSTVLSSCGLHCCGTHLGFSDCFVRTFRRGTCTLFCVTFADLLKKFCMCRAVSLLHRCALCHVSCLDIWHVPLRNWR